MKILTVNKLIEVEVSSYSGKNAYRSRVEQINSDGIWIATPINKGNLVLLRVGEKILIRYNDQLSIYSFIATVVKRVSEPLPMLLITSPGENQITRIQRRDFVRIPTVVPIEWGIIPDELDMTDLKFNKAQTLDLSGGGLQFITNLPIQENDLVQINLSLDSDMLILFGKSIRVREYSAEKQGYLAIGVKFININEIDRDKIIKFVFEWQRKMRRKGLL